jgi:hypothetical protein
MKWIGKEKFVEFVKNDYISYETDNRYYEISYIPGKIFSIRFKTKSNKNRTETVNFYDLTNFFERSLDYNAKKYLNKSKLKLINVQRFNEDLEYCKRVFETTKKYLKRDCEITRDLGIKLQKDMYTVLGLHPKKYISKAHVAENWLYTVAYVPSVNRIPKEVLSFAYRGFNGGRFESLKKGHYEGTIYDYDINSAYPTSMRNLININKGTWKKVTEQTLNADMGIYKCLVEVPACYIGPFGIKLRDGVIIYPQEYRSILYLNEQEIEAYEPYCKIEVIEGWEFYATKKIYPFQEALDKMFTKKKQNKKFGKYSMEYQIPKIILNSLYGKTVQVNKGNIAGKMFNPIYGQRITADTRIKIFLAGIKAGRDLVTLETDGIKTTKPIELDIGKELGQWEVSLLKELYIVGDGIFQSPGEVLKKRGIFVKNFNIQELTKTQKGCNYDYTRKKAITMKEAVIQHKYNWNQANTFKDVKRVLSVNFNRKRVWKRTDYTWEEIGKLWIDSEAWSGKLWSIFGK